MPVAVQLIKDMELFQNLSAEDINRISELAILITVIEGEVFMERGQAAANLFVVLSGHYMVHYENGAALTLNQKGALMGWSAVQSPMIYQSSGVALVPGQLLALAGTDLIGLFRENPEVEAALMEKIDQLDQTRSHLIRGQDPTSENL